MTNLDPNFWQDHFDKGHTPWDRRGTSPQLLQWLNSGELKPCRIAVPGCGKGWEVVELARLGFEVVGIDYTRGAIESASERLAQESLCAELIQADILSYTPEIAFDAIYEQTCLCAIDPDHWSAYVKQLHQWLRPEGYLYALFMQTLRPGALEGLKEGPPFHCDINAMHALFNSTDWIWPKNLPNKVPHPNGLHELAVRLQRAPAKK